MTKIVSGICVATFVLLSIHVQAQVDSTRQHKIAYWSTYMVGALFGNSERGGAFTFSTTQGIRIGRFTTGLGAGIDAYKNWKFVPLYASAGFDVLRLKRHAVYLQANGGYAFASYFNGDDGAPSYDADGGTMLNGMVGYRFQIGKNSLYLAGGYKLQRNHYTPSETYTIWSYPGSETTYKEDLRRAVVTVGIGLH